MPTPSIPGNSSSAQTLMVTTSADTYGTDVGYAGYSVQLVLSGSDAAAVYTQAAYSDGTDVTVWHWTGSAWIQLYVDLTAFSSGLVTLWFALQSNPGISSVDSNYLLCYGSPTAIRTYSSAYTNNTTPVWQQVYMFADDFLGTGALSTNWGTTSMTGVSISGSTATITTTSNGALTGLVSRTASNVTTFPWTSNSIVTIQANMPQNALLSVVGQSTGLRGNSASGSMSLAADYATNHTHWEMRAFVSTPGVNVDTGVVVDTSTHTFSIVRDNVGGFVGYIDGASATTGSGLITTTPLQLQLTSAQVSGGAAIITAFNWLILRHFTPTEPTVNFGPIQIAYTASDVASPGDFILSQVTALMVPTVTGQLGDGAGVQSQNTLPVVLDANSPTDVAYSTMQVYTTDSSNPQEGLHFQTNIAAYIPAEAYLRSWAFWSRIVTRPIDVLPGGYAGYVVTLELAGGIAANIFNASVLTGGTDVGVFHWTGSTWVQLFVDLSTFAQTQITLSYALQMDITPTVYDQNYMLVSGNAAADVSFSSTASGNSTTVWNSIYTFADDFLGSSLDLTKWNSNGSVALADSLMTLTGTPGSGASTLTSAQQVLSGTNSVLTLSGIPGFYQAGTSNYKFPLILFLDAAAPNNSQQSSLSYIGSVYTSSILESASTSFIDWVLQGSGTAGTGYQDTGALADSTRAHTYSLAHDSSGAPWSIITTSGAPQTRALPAGNGFTTAASIGIGTYNAASSGNTVTIVDWIKARPWTLNEPQTDLASTWALINIISPTDTLVGTTIVNALTIAVIDASSPHDQITLINTPTLIDSLTALDAYNTLLSTSNIISDYAFLGALFLLIPDASPDTYTLDDLILGVGTVTTQIYDATTPADQTITQVQSQISDTDIVVKVSTVTATQTQASPIFLGVSPTELTQTQLQPNLADTESPDETWSSQTKNIAAATGSGSTDTYAGQVQLLATDTSNATDTTSSALEYTLPAEGASSTDSLTIRPQISIPASAVSSTDFWLTSLQGAILESAISPTDTLTQASTLSWSVVDTSTPADSMDITTRTVSTDVSGPVESLTFQYQTLLTDSVVPTEGTIVQLLTVLESDTDSPTDFLIFNAALTSWQIDDVSTPADGVTQVTLVQTDDSGSATDTSSFIIQVNPVDTGSPGDTLTIAQNITFWNALDVSSPDEQVQTLLMSLQSDQGTPGDAWLGYQLTNAAVADISSPDESITTMGQPIMVDSLAPTDDMTTMSTMTGALDISDTVTLADEMIFLLTNAPLIDGIVPTDFMTILPLIIPQLIVRGLFTAPYRTLRFAVPNHNLQEIPNMSIIARATGSSTDPPYIGSLEINVPFEIDLSNPLQQSGQTIDHVVACTAQYTFDGLTWTTTTGFVQSNPSPTTTTDGLGVIVYCGNVNALVGATYRLVLTVAFTGGPIQTTQIVTDPIICTN